MRTDREIRLSGIEALVQSLGAVDAERFVALIRVVSVSKRIQRHFVDGNKAAFLLQER